MKRVLPFIQFLPIAVFLYTSKKLGYPRAFELGGLVAVLEFLILIKAQAPLSRLIGGVNAFLIFGGIAFVLKIDPALEILASLMEAALFACVFLVVLWATVFTQSGAFENTLPHRPLLPKKSSVLFTGLTLACVLWSYSFRGDTFLAGTLPFISLILAKVFFQRQAAL